MSAGPLIGIISGVLYCLLCWHAVRKLGIEMVSDGNQLNQPILHLSVPCCLCVGPLWVRNLIQEIPPPPHRFGSWKKLYANITEFRYCINSVFMQCRNIDLQKSASLLLWKWKFHLYNLGKGQAGTCMFCIHFTRSNITYGLVLCLVW